MNMDPPTYSVARPETTQEFLSCSVQQDKLVELSAFSDDELAFRRCKRNSKQAFVGMEIDHESMVANCELHAV